MNYPKYIVVTCINNNVVKGNPFNSNFIDFENQEKAEEYIEQNTSPYQRLIIKIISDNESYFTYVEKKI